MVCSTQSSTGHIGVNDGHMGLQSHMRPHIETQKSHMMVCSTQSSMHHMGVIDVYMGLKSHMRPNIGILFL